MPVYLIPGIRFSRSSSASWKVLLVPEDSYGPAAYRRGDGNGHHDGEEGPVLAACDGADEVAGEPSDGAPYPRCGAPCHSWGVTRHVTEDHVGRVCFRVAVTYCILPLPVDKTIEGTGK